MAVLQVFAARAVLAWLCFMVGMAQATEKAALAREVINASGIAATVSQYPMLFKQGVFEGLQEASGGTSAFPPETVDRIVDKAFNTPAMVDALTAEVTKALSEDDLNAVMTWLNSRDGKRVAEVEMAATSPDAFQDMDSKIVELQKQYRGSSREHLFNEFDRASQATESTLDAVIAVQLTLATALTEAAAGGGKKEMQAQLKQQIEDNRFMLRGLVGQQVYATYLYTYRELSEQELQAYIGYLASPAGQRFNRTTVDSLKSQLMGPVEQIGLNLATQLRSKNAE